MLQEHNLFKNVPNKDYLHLFAGNEVNARKVVDSLRFKNEEVAEAAGVPKQSVRYDEKIPVDLKDRLIEWATALNLVAQHFKDEHKTIVWFSVPNPLLGNISPRDMIRIGRSKKLLKFIYTALSENQR